MDEQDLQEQQRLVREAMRDLQEGSTVTADTFFRLNQETSKLNKTVEKAEESIDRFWRSGLGKTTKAIGDVTGGFVRGARAARENRESFESLNPVIEGAASALSAIPIVGDALGKTLSTVGTFVTAELQKSVEAFQTLGSVGGVGAAGVTGLRKSAEQAGLAFDQLAKITSTNAKGLAFATGSTAQGAKAVAQLTSAAEPFRGQLLALGVGITEQSEYFAEYLAMSRRLGRNQSNDYRTLATGAADYVKQLNLLSRLTGESADAMKAELESQQSNVMFRAALRQLPEEIQKGAQNIAAIAGTAGPQFRQGIQDMFGGSMGTEAAKAVFRATGGQARDIIDQYKNRLITQEEAVARLRDATERQRNTLGDQFFANAGNMSHAFTDVGIEMYNLADNAALTRENLAKAGIEAALAAEAQDPSTKGMVDAQLSLQRFAVEVDKFVNSQVFPNATGVMAQFTDSLSDLGGKINQLANDGDVTIGSSIGDAALAGAATGALGGAMAGPVGAAVGAAIGGILGTGFGTYNKYFGGAREFGGPVDPGKSYLVGEAGPELIIPEAPGTVIPNNQLSEAMAYAYAAHNFAKGSLTGDEEMDTTVSLSPSAQQKLLEMQTLAEQLSGKPFNEVLELAKQQHAIDQAEISRLFDENNSSQLIPRHKVNAYNELKVADNEFLDVFKKVKDRFYAEQDLNTGYESLSSELRYYGNTTGDFLPTNKFGKSEFNVKGIGYDIDRSMMETLKEYPDHFQSMLGIMPKLGDFRGTVSGFGGSRNRYLNKENFMSSLEMERDIAELLSNPDNLIQGYKNGGIASGPKSGYTAMLHGTEAVVPLPDGKNIPVQNNESKTNEQLELMGQQISRLDSLISLMQNQNDTSKKMLRATTA